MGFRDRFYTPKTARAILSWRIVLGVGVGSALAVLGLPVGISIGLGAAAYVASVAIAMPRGHRRPSIDPFALSEPWRGLIKSAQGSARKLRTTVEEASSGPLQDRLAAIADQLDHGLDEAWKVALRGDEIDDVVRRLDPTALRSHLATLSQRANANPSQHADDAVASIEIQLTSVDNLKRQSTEVADQLRLTQVKLNELVARASEVRVGSADTDTYAKDVDDLVIQLEALHRAVEETRTS